MDLLPHIEINPGGTAKSAIIWLHGLGADGNDFAPIVSELNLPSELGLRFIFPHAPSMPVTVNGGYIMPAWYDILEMQIERKVDTQQLLTSSSMIEAFIDRELERGIPANKIILAGFSQGGAVAYQIALSQRYSLAGLMCLSTYIATAERFQNRDFEDKPELLQLPLFIAHGTLDPVVPEALGQQAVKTLTDFGFKPEYKTYSMEHAVCIEEISDIGRWIHSTLT